MENLASAKQFGKSSNSLAIVASFHQMAPSEDFLSPYYVCLNAIILCLFFLMFVFY